MRFSDEFEKQFVGQEEFKNREIDESLDLGWELLKMIPRESLKRAKAEFIEKYMGSK